MSSPPSLRPPLRPAAATGVEALSRVALAVAHPGGPDLFADLVHELGAALRVRAVLLAVFPEDSRTGMRTVAVTLDGRPQPGFTFPIDAAVCAAMARRPFQCIPLAVVSHLAFDGALGGDHLQPVAALALTDTAGEPLGLLVALDRPPIVRRDARQTEALLRIVAIRASAEV